HPPPLDLPSFPTRRSSDLIHSVGRNRSSRFVVNRSLSARLWTFSQSSGGAPRKPRRPSARFLGFAHTRFVKGSDSIDVWTSRVCPLTNAAPTRTATRYVAVTSRLARAAIRQFQF